MVVCVNVLSYDRPPYICAMIQIQTSQQLSHRITSTVDFHQIVSILFNLYIESQHKLQSFKYIYILDEDTIQLSLSGYGTIILVGDTHPFTFDQDTIQLSL